MGRHVAGADVLLCGASYRQDVGDTRYSGSEIVVRKLTEMGAEMRVHDPYVTIGTNWRARTRIRPPATPGPASSATRTGSRTSACSRTWPTALKGVEAVIFAVPHEPYLELDPAQIVAWAGSPLAVIDCFGILSDDDDPQVLRAGLRSEGLGPRPHPASRNRCGPRPSRPHPVTGFQPVNVG